MKSINIGKHQKDIPLNIGNLTGCVTLSVVQFRY